MTELDSDPMRDQTGPEWCRQVGDAALDAFLAYAAGQAGEGITVAQLRALAQQFKSNSAIMAGQYRALWQAGGWSRRGSDIPDRRGAPMHRLLVERFAHLLAPAGSELTTLADGTPAINRAAIPGILAAMATMAPGNLWEQARRRCVDIVADLRMRSGAAFTWNQVERNPEVMHLLDDVRMAVLPYFSDLAKRRRWFITVVDRHQQDHYGPDAAGQPVLTKMLLDDFGFDRVIAAIFRDLAARLSDAEAGLAECYGAESVQALAQLLEQLPIGQTVPVPA